jgi:hypothetical protein
MFEYAFISHTVSSKKKRVHNSLIYRRILIIIHVPNEMVVNRIQNGLIKSQIAPRASGLSCQKKKQIRTHTFFIDRFLL